MTLRQLFRLMPSETLPIMMEGIEAEELVFEPDIGALKGKTVRSKPSPSCVELHRDFKRDTQQSPKGSTLH